MDSTVDISAARARLSERRAALLARIEASQESLGTEHDRDLGEQAIERETDEVFEHLGVVDRHEIEAIDAALDRIENGTYGVCARCGDDISAERLETLPHTPLCRNCASDR